MSAIGVIKEHPYIAGGAVLVTVVVVMLVVGGGGTDKSGTAVVSQGSGDDQAYAAITTAQINAGARANELSMQLEALSVSAGVANHAADLEFGQKMNEDTLASEIAKAGLTTQQNMTLATLTTQQTIALATQETQRYAIGTASNERINEVDAIRDMNLSHDASVATMNRDNLAAMADANRLNAETAVHQVDAFVNLQTQQNSLNYTLMYHQADVADQISARDAMVSENNNLRDNLTQQYRLGLEAALGHPLYG